MKNVPLICDGCGKELTGKDKMLVFGRCLCNDCADELDENDAKELADDLEEIKSGGN